MNKLDNKMKNFIDKTPNAYYCVENLRNKLLRKGYVELYEGENWDLKKDGKYFVVRNDSSIIAFNLCDKKNTGFNIVATHGDSPSFRIKSNPEMFDGSYLKLNVSGYGGMLNYTWLDRPLSFAGRVITSTDGVYERQLVNIDKNILVIPSQAIHINRDANEKNNLNHQVDLLPVLSLSKNVKLEDIVREKLSKQGKSVDRICDYDLYLYNRDKAKYIGANEEMILSPRLDDLGSVYPSFEAFLDSNNENSINVFGAFNYEEIGSLKQNGADSTFLIDTLTRICDSMDIELLPTLKNSFVVSADNAHAIHPSAASKSDPTNKVLLNNGIAIKHHTNYTTDGLSSSIFKDICSTRGVPVQDFECRSDMRCGATLGGISLSHVSVNSVDIGLPQLSMHSINETVGADDVTHMYNAINEFYDSTIITDKNKIRVLHK